MGALRARYSDPGGQAVLPNWGRSVGGGVSSVGTYVV